MFTVQCIGIFLNPLDTSPKIQPTFLNNWLTMCAVVWNKRRGKRLFSSVGIPAEIKISPLLVAVI
ncbi:hypothetical protein PHET_02754 [Paragonimus heterotremus]|uniref:Uncharacterized protein n=1 Tax=Paragonimus heterotremus TaxID=100268 RepID=A0A8J4WIG8_9TREM|nr:hypothetical protein PHET_02754 [Paragonimus heterotremus]